jgi:hypothetical protein
MWVWGGMGTKVPVPYPYLYQLIFTVITLTRACTQNADFTLIYMNIFCKYPLNMSQIIIPRNYQKLRRIRLFDLFFGKLDKASATLLATQLVLKLVTHQFGDQIKNMRIRELSTMKFTHIK